MNNDIIIALNTLSKTLVENTGRGDFEIKLPFDCLIKVCEAMVKRPTESFEWSCAGGDIVTISLKNGDNK